MKRRFRLTKTTDIQRVYRYGKSFAHPRLVLIAVPNSIGKVRFAVVAGRSVGNAVKRNRAKRLIRSALVPYLNTIESGWDVLLIARKPITTTTLQQTQSALSSLLARAGLFLESNEI